jgi:hypothetical protein
MTAPAEAPENVIPLRPADGQPDKAHHARTREESPSGDRWTQVWLRLQVLLAGGSLLDLGTPSLLVVWARHVAAAKAWGSPVLTWPRYCWGAVHTCLIAPACRFTEWALDSPPKALASALTIITTLWWFHII